VDFICYRPVEATRSIRLFQGRTAQFIFISSASVYQKPPTSHVITESTPLSNPFWDYSRAKIGCEAVFREAYANSSFPVTIVRPSHTYDDGWVPTTFSSRDFTVPQRILDDRPIVIHGDGQSLWTLTHSRDFASGLAGLAGNPATCGESFHITSDEAMTWDTIHGTIAEALGRPLNAVHIPSDIIARVLPERGDSLLGDKTYSTTFDNAKLKRFVPDFQARISFHQGVRQSLSYLRTHPDALSFDPQLDRDLDLLLSRWNAMS
jgi:nucleoside-diphosphate-sugar epimerase